MEIGGKSHQWPDYGLEFQMFDGSQQYFDIEATFDGVWTTSASQATKFFADRCLLHLRDLRALLRP